MNTSTMTVAVVSSLNLSQLTGYAFCIRQDANLADDAVQTAISHILSRISKIGEFAVDNVDSFVKQSVRNAVYNIARTQKNQRIESEQVETILAKPVESDGMEVLENITLTRQELKVVSLLLECKTQEEIQAEMEISNEYYRKICQRIRDKVRDSIK